MVLCLFAAVFFRMEQEDEEVTNHAEVCDIVAILLFRRYKHIPCR